MIKDREGGRYMRWRNRHKRYFLDRHSLFNFLHDKFKGKLSFEGRDAEYSEEEIEEIGGMLADLSVYDLWKKYSR